MDEMDGSDWSHALHSALRCLALLDQACSTVVVVHCIALVALSWWARPAVALCQARTCRPSNDAVGR